MKNYLISIISILFIFNITYISGQSVKRAYKALEKQDYLKAYEEFKDVLSKDRGNPAALFGITYLYSHETTGYYNIFNAWKEAVQTEKNLGNLSTDDSEIMKEFFLSQEVRKSSLPVKKKITNYLDIVETKLIRFMREENNLDVVNKFLKEFKDFESYDNVIHIRNYLEYRKAENENTLAAINEFLTKRYDAAQVELAREKRNELAFKEAKAKNTTTAINNFIESYPDAIQIPEAITIRNRLEFEKVQQINTFEAYQQYIEKFPNSTYIPKIREIQKKLVYEQAKRINTIEAYNKFISMYPDGAQYIDIFNLKTEELGKKFNSLNMEFKGTINWTKGYDDESNDNIAKDLCYNINGEVFIAGATMQDDTSEYLNAWIIKLDASHKLLWNKIIGERWHDIPRKIITDNNNNIIVAGIMNKVVDTIPGKAWIFKLTSEGKKIWNRKFDMPEILSMDVNSNNQIILGGYQSNDTLPENYVLYKLTSQGRKFWKRTYSKFGRVNDIKITSNDDILIAGDKWLWKLNDQGYIIWENNLGPTDSIVSIYELSNGNIVYLGNRDKSQCLIKMLSPKGKTIFEKSFSANAIICEPIDIISSSTELIFTIKLDNYYKLLYSDMNGNLTNEFDFNPNVVADIACLYPVSNGQIVLLITADNLGQKKDIIITQIK